MVNNNNTDEMICLVKTQTVFGTVVWKILRLFIAFLNSTFFKSLNSHNYISFKSVNYHLVSLYSHKSYLRGDSEFDSWVLRSVAFPSKKYRTATAVPISTSRKMKSFYALYSSLFSSPYKQQGMLFVAKIITSNHGIKWLLCIAPNDEKKSQNYLVIHTTLI